MFIFNKKGDFVAVVLWGQQTKTGYSVFTFNFYLPPNRQLPQQSGGNNSAGVIDRKRRTPYSPICGLGASVGYEP